MRVEGRLLYHPSVRALATPVPPGRESQPGGSTPPRKKGVIVPSPRFAEPAPDAGPVWELIQESGKVNASRPDVPAPPLKPREEKRTSSPPGRNGQGVAHLFEKVLRSFRIRLFEIVGSRQSDLIREGERKVRFLDPEFNLDELSEESAASVLDVIEEAVRRAPFFKRTRLRKIASMLVADLYEKHFDVLEKAGVLDKVEETYYRIKR
jgi:hypothetical protein